MNTNGPKDGDIRCTDDRKPILRKGWANGVHGLVGQVYRNSDPGCFGWFDCTASEAHAGVAAGRVFTEAQMSAWAASGEAERANRYTADSAGSSPSGDAAVKADPFAALAAHVFARRRGAVLAAGPAEPKREAAPLDVANIYAQRKAPAAGAAKE